MSTALTVVVIWMTINAVIAAAFVVRGRRRRRPERQADRVEPVRGAPAERADEVRPARTDALR